MTDKVDDYPKSDDEYLDFNMRLRHDIAVELTTDSEGKRHIPRDPQMLTALRGILKDNDNNVHTKRRLNVDELNAENDTRAASLLESMLGQAKTLPREREDRGGNGPDLDRARLPEFEVSEHVTSEVGNTVDLDEITQLGRAHFKGDSEAEA